MHPAVALLLAMFLLLPGRAAAQTPHSHRHDFSGAEPILRKVLELKPDYAKAHYLLGMTCVNTNKIPDMKKHLAEYLKLDPKGADAATAREMLDAFK